MSKSQNRSKKRDIMSACTSFRRGVTASGAAGMTQLGMSAHRMTKSRRIWATMTKAFRRSPTGKTNGSANMASTSSYNAGTDRPLLMNLSNSPAFLMRFTTATSTPFTRTIPSLPSCGKTTSQKPSRPRLLKSTLFPSLSSIISKIPAITK